MNLPPLSHTFLSDYEACPLLAYEKYIVKSVKWEGNAATEWGNAVHKGMEQRLMHGKPLPDEMQQFEGIALAVEQLGLPLNGEMPLGCTYEFETCGFFADNVWFRGKLDCPLVSGHIAILLDWKTGSKREDATELERNAVLLKCRFPEVTVIKAHYVWMNDVSMGKQHDCSNVRATAEGLRAQARKIVEQGERGHWPPRESWRCKTCPVTKCAYNRSDKK